MKNWYTIFFYVLAGIILGWVLKSYVSYALKSSQNPINQIKPRPLAKYTIENIGKTEIPGSEIKIERTMKENADFISYLISFKAEGKKVSGILNVPKGKGPFPIILMFRGYVDQKQYVIGQGTKHAGEYFAENGFITLAPDFLGYGESDPEAGNIFESRFQTYTTAITAINSAKSIDKWNQKDIFLWGHSNGGQIALTVLEITKKSYPTVLWAPVSKPFPYSVLYFTDESGDGGKLIRRELSNFEEDYDTDQYSLPNYLDRISAPMQLHQGTADDSVPLAWSDSIVAALKKAGKDIVYYKYPGASHNLTPGWDTAVARSLSFYEKHQAKF